MKKSQTKVPLPQCFTRSPQGFEAYSRIPQSLFRSDSVRNLSHAARSVYIDMIDVASGKLEVIYTQDMAYEHFGMSKGGYTSSINQLVENGLIERLPRSWYSPAKFHFSEKWKNQRTTE